MYWKLKSLSKHTKQRYSIIELGNGADPLARTPNVTGPNRGWGSKFTKGGHTGDGWLTSHDHSSVRERNYFVPVIVNMYVDVRVEMLNVRHQRVHQYFTSMHYIFLSIINPLLAWISSDWVKIPMDRTPLRIGSTYAAKVDVAMKSHWSNQ